MARLEDAFERGLVRVLARRGWRPVVVPYTGYGRAGTAGDPGFVRVLARVLLLPPGEHGLDDDIGRGWRRFLTVTVAGARVQLRAGTGPTIELVTERGGYLDVPVCSALPAGWHEARLRCDLSERVLRLRVVGAGERAAVVSDIDDTVLVTALPRPLLAAWNTFVRHEDKRWVVPGMPELLRALVGAARGASGPDDPLVVYVSTGAWNVQPALRRFLRRHGYPEGPLLLTDWGPTSDSWFRSGSEHKRTQLRRLLAELPGVTFGFVGDDGQHDPELYGEVACAAPERVSLVAVRQLTPTEQLLTHGRPGPEDQQSVACRNPGHTVDHEVPQVEAPDGYALLDRLRRRGLLP